MFKRTALIIPLLSLAMLAPHAAYAAEATTVTTQAPTAEPKEDKGLISFEPLTAFWVLMVFLVLLFVLYKNAWKNVLSGLKSREQRIRFDIAEAESARAKSEATLKDYAAQLETAQAKVREMIAEATLQTQRIQEQGRIRAQEEAEQIRERTMKDIEEARKQAVSQIYEQAADLATSVAEKILRRNLNVEDQRDLVNRSMDQIGTVTRN